MALVADTAVDIQTILVLRVLRERLVRRCGLFHHDASLPEHPDIALQLRNTLDELGRRIEADLRLGLVDGGSIYLRRALSVQEEHVQGDHGREGGLSVLTRDIDVRVGVLALLGGLVLQSEDIGQAEELPRLPLDGPAGEFALVMLEHAREADHTKEGGPVEV